ncbi:MAG TPA: hypothetical protein VF160_17010 [Candidatus Dormibacteraeota bacterium]
MSLQSGILVLGVGFLLRITGAIPLDPTGTLIFSLGLLLIAGFLLQRWAYVGNAVVGSGLLFLRAGPEH